MCQLLVILLCSRCVIEENWGEINAKYKEGIMVHYKVGIKMGWSIGNAVDILREVHDSDLGRGTGYPN
jgi:hypothetical protein